MNISHKEWTDHHTTLLKSAIEHQVTDQYCRLVNAALLENSTISLNDLVSALPYPDCVIRIGTESLPAHRAILFSASRYFATYLHYNMRASKVRQETNNQEKTATNIKSLDDEDELKTQAKEEAKEDKEEKKQNKNEDAIITIDDQFDPELAIRVLAHIYLPISLQFVKERNEKMRQQEKAAKCEPDDTDEEDEIAYLNTPPAKTEKEKEKEREKLIDRKIVNEQEGIVCFHPCDLWDVLALAMEWEIPALQKDTIELVLNTLREGWTNPLSRDDFKSSRRNDLALPTSYSVPNLVPRSFVHWIRKCHAMCVFFPVELAVVKDAMCHKIMLIMKESEQYHGHWKRAIRLLLNAGAPLIKKHRQELRKRARSWRVVPENDELGFALYSDKNANTFNFVDVYQAALLRKDDGSKKVVQTAEYKCDIDQVEDEDYFLPVTCFELLEQLGGETMNDLLLNFCAKQIVEVMPYHKKKSLPRRSFDYCSSASVSSTPLIAQKEELWHNKKAELEDKSELFHEVMEQMAHQLQQEPPEQNTWGEPENEESENEIKEEKKEKDENENEKEKTVKEQDAILLEQQFNFHFGEEDARLSLKKSRRVFTDGPMNDSSEEKQNENRHIRSKKVKTFQNAKVMYAENAGQLCNMAMNVTNIYEQHSAEVLEARMSLLAIDEELEALHGEKKEGDAFGLQMIENKTLFMIVCFLNNIQLAQKSETDAKLVLRVMSRSLTSRDLKVLLDPFLQINGLTLSTQDWLELMQEKEHKNAYKPIDRIVRCRSTIC